MTTAPVTDDATEQILSTIYHSETNGKQLAFVMTLSSGECEAGYGREYRGKDALEQATHAQKREARIYDDLAEGEFLIVSPEVFEREHTRRKKLAQQLFRYQEGS